MTKFWRIQTFIIGCLLFSAILKVRRLILDMRGLKRERRDSLKGGR